VGDHLVAVGLHREERPEKLLLHDRHVLRRIEDQMRRDLAHDVVVGRARHQWDDARALALGVVERRAQAAVGLVVDDRREGAIVDVGIARRDDALRRGDELIALAFRH
jgi:hypothetical protein